MSAKNPQKTVNVGDVTVFPNPFRLLGQGACRSAKMTASIDQAGVSTRFFEPRKSELAGSESAAVEAGCLRFNVVAGNADGAAGPVSLAFLALQTIDEELI